jgi:hypothetical protein
MSERSKNDQKLVDDISLTDESPVDEENLI